MSSIYQLDMTDTMVTNTFTSNPSHIVRILMWGVTQQKIEHFLDFYWQKRLVIAKDDVQYVIGNLLGFTNLLFVLQFDALFSEERTICEVNATNSG
jgi:hypothetical protein